MPELRALRNISMKIGPLIQEGATFFYTDQEEIENIVRLGYAEIVTNPVVTEHTINVESARPAPPSPYSVPLVVGRKGRKA